MTFFDGTAGARFAPMARAAGGAAWWSAITRLTQTTAADRSAAWSPDGRSVAFKSERAGAVAGTYVMSADGSNQRRVGTYDSGHGIPFFDPDGRRLLETRTGAAGAEIWTVDIAGGTATRISACRPVDDSHRSN